MKRIVIILIGLISVAYGQSSPTSAKTRFVNGLYVGTKLDSYFAAADSNAIYWRADSALMAKYKGTARALAFSGDLGVYKLIADTFFTGGYTTRARLKQYGDSLGAVKVNYTDTAALVANLLRKTDTLTMLLPYLRKSDTLTMLANRLKISDTLNMLSPYARTTALGNYLPLTAGSGQPLSGDLYGTNLLFSGYGSFGSAASTATNLIAISSSYAAANTERGSIAWGDGTGIVGKIYSTFNGSNSTKLHFGGMFDGAYNGSDVMMLDGLTKSTTLYGALSTSGSATASSFIKSGGASSDFLMANGSVLSKNEFYIGDATFDTTTRALTIPKAGGGSTSVVIPRGTASGTSGITALSSSRTGNLVTVSGDNGSSTIFSVRDADSLSAFLFSDTADLVSPYLRKSDTATMLAPFMQYSDTANMLSPYARTTALGSYLPLSGGILTGGLSGTSLTMSGAGSFGTTLGVGIASPSSTLHVKSAADATLRLEQTSSGYSTITSTDFGIMVLNADVENGYAGSSIRFLVDNTEWARIADNGTFLINTTTTDAGVSKLIVNGAIKGTSIVKSGGLNTEFLKADGSVDANTYLTSSSITGKLNISDTVAMLLPYLRKTDTLSMLSPYRRTTTKITNSDLANSTISGIALGASLNNLTAGNGLTGTAYNGSVGYTWQVDTSVISTKANVTGSLVAKLNISDTASMLSNRLKISDTSNMLSGYARSGNIPTLESGTYTPTITNTTNISSSTARVSSYTRIGNIVTVTGWIALTITGNEVTSVVGISLPIASNFTAFSELSGSGNHYISSNGGQVGKIEADTTNDRATLTFYPIFGAGSSIETQFTFTYRVL